MELRDADVGWVVTCGRFSDGAKQVAKDAAKRVRLIEADVGVQTFARNRNGPELNNICNTTDFAVNDLFRSYIAFYQAP